MDDHKLVTISFFVFLKHDKNAFHFLESSMKGFWNFAVCN